MTDLETIELAIRRTLERIPSHASGGFALERLAEELVKIAKERKVDVG